MKCRKLVFKNGPASRNEISVEGNNVTLSHSNERQCEDQFRVEFPLRDVRAVKLLRLRRILDALPRWSGIMGVVVLCIQFAFLSILPLLVVFGVGVEDAWIHACMLMAAILTFCFIWFRVLAWLLVEAGNNGRLIIYTDRCEYVAWFRGQEWGQFADYARRLMSYWRTQTNEAEVK